VNVLVVDDDEDRLQFFRTELRPLGHVVETAINVSSAEVFLSEHWRHWDVVFLDHGLNDWGSNAPGERPREKTGVDVAKVIVGLPAARRPSLVVIHSWYAPGAMDIMRVLLGAGVHVTRWVFKECDPLPVASWGLAR
jgi:CheY-like chemotaxis protein